MKNSIIIATIALGVMTVARAIMYTLTFATGGIISIPGLVITMLLPLLVLIGILKKHRLAWQWGRLLGLLGAIILTLLAVLLFSRIGEGPLMLLAVLTIAIQGISLFVMFFALGTTGAREYFQVICPECNNRKIKAGNFLFSKVICRKCNAKWS